MAVKITSNSGAPDTEATEIQEWAEHDCGYDDDGDLWIRGVDGAVCLCGSSINCFNDEELEERMAIKDPNITVEIKVCK